MTSRSIKKYFKKIDTSKFKSENEDIIQLPSSGSVMEKIRRLEMGNPDLSFPRGVELGWVTNKTNNSNQLPFRIGNQMNFVGTFSKSTNKNQEQMNSDGIEPAGGLGLSDKSSVSPKLWDVFLHIAS